jgi:type II secretory pathway pseudopilin PulG
MRRLNRHAQVWIESVLYTLIGITMIGLVLAFAMPKINESKDRLRVEQAISSLNVLDEKLTIASRATGNIRTVEFGLNEGELLFDGPLDEIRMVLPELSGVFSEPGTEIEIGRVRLLTEEGQKTNTVTLRVPYLYDLQVNGVDEIGKFTGSSVPYVFALENMGPAGDGRVVMNIKEISGA